jgi:carbon starvation protein
LFGIANQLLASIALCVATTILIKMHRAKYMWITCMPLVWLLVVTYTASYQKIFSPSPRIGFLSQADQLQASLANAGLTAAQMSIIKTQIFNARLDAVVCAIFVVLVTAIVVDSIRVWVGILRGTREAKSSETAFVLTQLRPEEI